MKKYLLLFCCLMMSGISATAWGADIEFLADFRPGTLLLSSKTEDFEAVGPNKNLSGMTELEDAGNLSSLPNMKLGIGLRGKKTFLDFTGQLGLLVDVSLQYRYKKNVGFGPHLGFLAFPDPEWTGDADIDFSDSYGFLGGFQVSIGYDIFFVFSIDYLLAQPMDVDVTEPWQVTDDELDISGMVVQFGMQGRF